MRAIALKRPGKRPLLVQAHPLRGEARGHFGSARVALLVTNFDARSHPSALLLRQAFGLTPAEAKLLLALTASAELRAAAGACGISYETARFYVKTIFGKTNTRSQGDLLALVARAG